jgi:hypothetical protein
MRDCDVAAADRAEFAPVIRARLRFQTIAAIGLGALAQYILRAVNPLTPPT